MGGAGEGEAAQDPQEGHGEMMPGLVERGALIGAGSELIGRDAAGHLIRDVGVTAGGADGGFSTRAEEHVSIRVQITLYSYYCEDHK